MADQGTGEDFRAWLEVPGGPPAAVWQAALRRALSEPVPEEGDLPESQDSEDGIDQHEPRHLSDWSEDHWPDPTEPDGWPDPGGEVDLGGS